MPLNSVQLYVANLLNDLAVPMAGIPPIEAYVTPPIVEDIDRPKAYVWGGRARGRRQTMPRNISGVMVDGKSGFKHIDWHLDIYTVYETTPDADNLDMEFPCIVDAIMTKLWTTPLNVFITDPITDITSEITSIGEEWDYEMLPERTPNTLRMIYYSSRITMMVSEVIQG